MKQLLEEITNHEINCYGIECNAIVQLKIEHFILHRMSSVGVVRSEDGFYENFSVRAYLHFFAGLAKRKTYIKQAVEDMQLHDILKKKMKKISNTQRVRVFIAREILMNHDTVLLQEPLKYLDDASMRLVLKWIEHMKDTQKKVFVLSSSFKDICMMPGINYAIDHHETVRKIEEIDTTSDVKHIEQPARISVKVNDKVFLFHPHEIDYVESMQGKNYLYIRSESFVCTQTMDELEEQLKQYGFFRSHRSYLVNMQKVKEIVKWTKNSYTLKLEGLEEIRVPLSKGRIEDMKQIFNF